MVLKAGATLIADNKYGIELANGSRVLALSSNDESIRGLTVDGWIVADEAAFLTDEVVAALRPMRAQRPEARYVMLSTANTRTDPFWSAWETGDQSWMRIQVTVDVDDSLYSQDYLDQERRALGEERYKREFLGIPTGGQVSPFTHELYERATQNSIHPASRECGAPTIIVHDVGHTRDRSTAVIGGKNYLDPELTLIKECNELPQGLYGSARAEALASFDRLYDSKTIIFVDLTYDPTYAEILVERFGPKRAIGLRITNSGDGMTPHTTPIPRPSRYYGRRQNQLSEHFRAERRQAQHSAPAAPPLAPAEPVLLPASIDKSQLPIAEPKRLRDKAHLKFVASQPCLVCGREPSDPHHLRFAQPRALGMKVSDEFTVPLCRGHHRQLHQAGKEQAWWDNRRINALEVARGLWLQTHPLSAISLVPHDGDGRPKN